MDPLTIGVGVIATVMVMHGVSKFDVKSVTGRFSKAIAASNGNTLKKEAKKTAKFKAQGGPARG